MCGGCELYWFFGLMPGFCIAYFVLILDLGVSVVFRLVCVFSSGLVAVWGFLGFLSFGFRLVWVSCGCLFVDLVFAVACVSSFYRVCC